METNTLSKETRDEISFLTFIVPEFAAAYKMNIQDAYRYLKQYGGIDYLREHWWALHREPDVCRWGYKVVLLKK